MLTDEPTIEPETEHEPGVVGGRARSRWARFRSWLRARPRTWIRRIHLAMTFTLGLWLLVVCTSGALVVLHPEIDRLMYSSLYQSSTGATSIGATRAIASAQDAYPGWTVTNVVDVSDATNWAVELSRGEDDFQTAYVDGSTGRVVGTLDHGGTLMGLLAGFHTALAVGSASADDVTIPLVDWNLATTILGGAGLALLVMVATGIVLWWPGIRRFFARGFGMKLRRSAHRRNYDLHKVVGIVVLPVLAMWAFTGVNFEFYDETKKVWYAVLPGGEPSEMPELKSAPTTGSGIDADRALAIASAAVDSARPTSVAPPPDETGVYDVWVSKPADPWAFYDWAGNVNLMIDRGSGAILADSRQRYADSPTAYAYETWTYPVHTGAFMSWGPRILWLVLGLLPLLLAVTGLRMWWLKRRGRRRLEAARAHAD